MPRTTSTARALVIVAALASCKDKQDDTSDTTPTTTAELVPATPPRVPPFEAPKLGAQRGYLDRGLLYAAVRIDRVQAFAQRLPLPPEAAGKLAELGAEFGIDFRVDDVRARFGLASDAVVSMTIARPLAADAEAVRAELVRGGPFLEALGMPTPPIPAVPVPEVELGFRAEEPPPARPPVELPPPGSFGGSLGEPLPEHGLGTIDELPPGHGLGIIGEPPPPPQPSLEAVAQAEKFLRKASTLGIHSRIHIPAENPSLLANELRRIRDREGGRWADVCRAIPGDAVCAGDSDLVLVLRESKAAVDIDIVWFATAADHNAPGREVALREAVLAPTVERPHLSSLRGDAAMYLDVSQIDELATIDALGHAIRSVEYTPGPDRRATIDRRLERATAVQAVTATPMLYRGLAFEVAAEGTVHARLRWDVEPERAELAEKLLAGPPPTTEVPTIDALCTDAVACARMRGLPTPSSWRDALATGVFASPQRDLMNKLDAGDAWGGLLLFGAAWPNFVGAVTRWPAEEIGRGPQGAIANNMFESIGKIEGFGASLRIVSAVPDRIELDYVMYGRMKKTELDLIRSLLGFSGLTPTDTAIEGVTGNAQTVELPGIVPASLLLYADPPPAMGSQYGWAALSDDADELAWLIGLPRDRGEGPSAYFEVPDLWQLAGAHPSLARELGFARSWLTARHLRVAIDIVDGAPHVVATSDVTRSIDDDAKGRD